MDTNNHLSAVAFPPAIADKTYNKQWRSGEIKYSGIKGSGRFFTHLLGGTGAD